MITRLAAALSMLFVTLTPAFADPFNININNGESSMVLVTVTDMNLPNPQQQPAFSGSINSGQLISVNINGENGNNGHIQWTATSPDRAKCGSGDLSGLSTGNNVTVSTPSSC